MAVPRNRVSNRHRNQRRAHHALKGTTFTSCLQCGNKTRPHRACTSCGTYRKREVVPQQAQ